MSGARLRILIAMICGAVMVSAALVMNLNHQKVAQKKAEQATSALSLSDRKHIKVTDSDQDGVPDWQANLVDGDPIFLDATSSEPYIPPDTVTGQFSVRFFKDVITLDSLGLLSGTKEELIETSIRNLEEKTTEPIYTNADLANISVVTDKEALRAYGNLVVGYIFRHQSDESELSLFERMISSNNPKHLEKLALIEQQYDAIIHDLLTQEVPSQYTYEHLAIVNSLSALRENVRGMQQYFDDPFYTSMRYRRLTEDALGMNTAIHNLYDALYLDENIQFGEDDVLKVIIDLLPQS